MSFCDLTSSQIYCVKTRSIFDAPQITSLKSTSPTSIEVKWINPQNYKKVEIYVSKPNDINNFSSGPKIRYFAPSSETIRCRDTQKTCDTPVEHTTTTSDGINPGTLYGVRVRGYLK